VSNENYGKYQLLKRLAMGGMARIYLARWLGDVLVEEFESASPVGPSWKPYRLALLAVGAGLIMGFRGERDLGSTPLPDVPFNAGVYECRFSNPELGMHTQRVEVKANSHTTVVVKF